MGVGWVGGALARYFDDAGHRVVRFDPPKGLGTLRELATAEVVFVCVPTPHREGLGCDLSYVEEAIATVPGERTVVIKSTVAPGTTEAMQEKFPHHRILFNPEFLREKTADEDMRHPERQLVGHTDASRDAADDVLSLLPNAPYARTLPATDAEIVKYFGNSFLAAKVVFANQMFDLCAAVGADYETVRDCVAGDGRIGPSHLKVLDQGYRGYGGNCFPKDVRAIIAFADAAGVDLSLLKKVEELNNELVRSSMKIRAERDAA